MRITPLSVKFPAGSAVVAGADHVDRVDCLKVESGEYLAVRWDVLDREEEAPLWPKDLRQAAESSLLSSPLPENCAEPPFGALHIDLRGSIRSAARPKSRLIIPWDGFFDGVARTDGQPIGRCRIQ